MGGFSVVAELRAQGKVQPIPVPGASAERMGSIKSSNSLQQECSSSARPFLPILVAWAPCSDLYKSARAKPLSRG